jgi:hypothetical protein
MFEDDVVTLVCHMAGIDEQSDTYIEQADEWLYAHHEMTLEQFTQVVSLIMPYCPALSSPLTKKHYHVLGTQDAHGFTAIVKKEML